MKTIAVVGGGIVGTCTSRALKLRFPNHKIILLDKESSLGTQQTGHNSGVIHAGIYYKPNTLKAKLCLKGSAMVYDYLKKNDPFQKHVKVEQCGKVRLSSVELLLAHSRH
jgi:2-hydroxyglutarate dehydrogenase